MLNDDYVWVEIEEDRIPHAFILSAALESIPSSREERQIVLLPSEQCVVLMKIGAIDLVVLLDFPVRDWDPGDARLIN